MLGFIFIVQIVCGRITFWLSLPDEFFFLDRILCFLTKIIKKLLRKSQKKILPRTRKKHKIPILFIFLVLLGACLRFSGLDYGLPLKIHPDEGEIINPAVRMATYGGLDPEVYHRPNHISIYLNAIGMKMYWLVSKRLFKTEGIVHAQFKMNPSPYFQVSRAIVAFLGTLMIFSMYGLGKEVGGRRVGLFAAFCTAFFPSFIRHSHHATPDIPLAFFISMVALFACQYMKRKEIKFLVWGSIFCGLATAEKYPGLLSLSLIALVIGFSHWPRMGKIVRLGILSFLAFCGSMFTFAPFLFLNYRRVIAGITRETYTHHLGASGLGWHGNLAFYLKALYKNAGLFLFLCFLIGAWLAVIRFRKIAKTKPYLTVCLFGVIYWVLLSKMALHWERWAVPMYVAPIIMAAVAVDRISRDTKQRSGGIKTAFFGFLVLLVISLSLRGLFQSVGFIMADTRVVSRAWIAENIPRGARMAADIYTPVKPLGKGIAADKSLSEHKKDGVEYVVISSAVYERIRAEKKLYPVEVQFYRSLFNEERLIKTFSPSPIELGSVDVLVIFRGIRSIIQFLKQDEIVMNGPEIRIYKLSGVRVRLEDCSHP